MRLPVVLAAVLILAACTGCRSNTKDVAAVAQAGSETSGQLAALYATLSDDLGFFYQATQFRRARGGDFLEALYVSDIVDGKAFVTRLKTSQEPATVAVKSKLSQPVRDKIAQYDVTKTPDADLMAGLVADLNALLLRPGFYDAPTFAGVTLSAPSRDFLAGGQPAPVDIGNRFLLEDVFPDDIAKSIGEDVRAQQEALAEREALAEKMKTVYDALKDLAGYDASGQIKGAVDDLRRQVEAANHHPLTITGVPLNAKPKDILDEVARDLGDVALQSHLRRDEPKVLRAAQLMRQFYAAEVPLYVAIAREYHKASGNLAKALLKSHEVSGLSFLQKPLDAYSLQVIAQPDTNANSVEWERRQADLTTTAQIKADSARIRDMDKQLYALVVSLDKLMHKGRSTLPSTPAA